MSAYGEVKTEYRDAELLCAALRILFPQAGAVRYSAIPEHLEGYHGDKRNETAEIIIPREFVGCASNDLGFKRQADGTFVAIVSAFDSHRYGAQWQKTLRNTYAEAGIYRQAKRAGLRPVGKKTINGKIQYQFVKA